MDPQNTTPQQPTQNNTDLQSPANASDTSGQPTVTLPQQPVSQQATPNQQISVGGSESSATIETQKSSEQVSNEPSPQTQQLIQSTSQLQSQARKAKNQGDIAGAVEQEKKILQQLSGLSPNPVNASTTPTSPIPKQQPVAQLTQEIPPQKQNMVDSPDAQVDQVQEAPVQPKLQTVQAPQVPTQQKEQSISSVQPQGSQPVLQVEEDVVESPQTTDTSTIEEDILKDVQQKYSQFTTNAPASTGIIKATTVATPTSTVPPLTNPGVSHDGFTDVKVVSETQGTITLSPDPKKEEEGTFHRRFSQAPVPAQKTITQKPEEQPAVQIAEGALGQAVAVSLLDAIVKRLAAEEEKNLNKLTVSDSEEASYRFMEEGVLRAVTERIRSGEWTNKEHLEMLATKLGYFAAIDVLRDLKEQALDDKSQTTIQQAIDYLMNEYDQIEITEAQQAA